MKWEINDYLNIIGASRKLLYSTLTLFISAILLASTISLITPNNSEAANFTMQTGYYVGTGVAGLAITGVGFQPDFIMIKSTTAAGAAVFKTSTMPANTTAFTSATVDNTTTQITLDSDGFTLGTLANVNSVNVIYNWIAVGGSDCSATGNFCVGTYTGNGVSPRNIAVGFQANMALVKRTTAVAGHFRVSSQPANETIFLTNTARNTTGTYIRSFGASDFAVGATDNTAAAVYYFVAFKDTAGAFGQGTFVGNAVDNRNITGFGASYTPNFVLTKNATSATANDRRPLMNFSDSFGDSSSHVGVNTANTTNGIQSLQSDGFQVGTSASSNGSGATMYWFALGGNSSFSSSGDFNIKTGSYSGTGVSNPITGLGFRPDLVIIKANTAQVGVFRTKTMKGDSTAYLSNNVANFAGGISSLDNDGFTVGTAAQTNSAGVTYQWQAFGNAFDPYDNSGSSDFAVGSFYGNGIDSRNISRLPWQPNMVAIKANTTQVGVWKPSSLAGDSATYFGATANTANVIQAINSDGFQVGTSAQSNSSGVLSHWFAFKNGNNFTAGSYTGTGSAQSITSAGHRSEYVWVKRSTAVNGVSRPVRLTGNNTQYFVATANVSDRITGFVKNGFRVGGNQTETNTSGGTYYYASWNEPNYGNLNLDIVDGSDQSVASPSFAMSTLGYNFNCTNITGSLGSASQKIRVSNLTTTPGWSASIAATAGNTDLWRNTGDTEQYDFNDPLGTPNGCTDGPDADSEAGQLTINPSAGTITPETGCTNSNVSLGSSSSFNQGTTDSLQLISATSSANSDCIWDITGINLSQYVPAEQPIGTYDINLTITIIAN
jgi:hypothetical protein